MAIGGEKKKHNLLRYFVLQKWNKIFSIAKKEEKFKHTKSNTKNQTAKVNKNCI